MEVVAKNKGINQKLFDAIIKTNLECPYHEMLEMYITELGYGEAVLIMPISEKHMNPRRIVHGGATLSLLDTALGMAAKSLNTNVVTLEMNTNFLKPVKINETIKAVGKVSKPGKSIIVVESTAYNEQGEKIAVGRGTYYVIGIFVEDAYD